MPIVELRVEVSSHQLDMIDHLRGTIPRDEFLRLALELGVNDFLDESVRTSKDYIYQSVLHASKHYDKARTARQFAPAPQGEADAQTLDEAAPLMRRGYAR